MICSKFNEIPRATCPPLPAIFPDPMAPVFRINDGERELTMMRWGMNGIRGTKAKLLPNAQRRQAE